MSLKDWLRCHLAEFFSWCTAAYSCTCFLALTMLWVLYLASLDDCNYKVNAVIVSNKPSTEFWDRCLMMVKYPSPLPEDARAFLYTLKLPGKACVTAPDDPRQQQGEPGIGMKLEGCIRTSELQHFLSDKEGNKPPGFTSQKIFHGLFVAAVVVSILGTLILVGIFALTVITSAVRDDLKAERGSELSRIRFSARSLRGDDSSSGSGEIVCPASASHFVVLHDEVDDPVEGRDGEGDPLIGDVVLKSTDQC